MCEISDVTMSTTCMNVICTNKIIRLGLTPAYDNGVSQQTKHTFYYKYSNIN